MKRIAAIDFGSNAIRLSIADVVAVGKYKLIEKFRFPVRIGSDVFGDGEISETKQDEIYEVFRKFRGHIRYFHAEEVEAVATSALRDAKNSNAVIKKIEEISEIKIRLISGIEEATLISKILTQEFPIVKGVTLLVDIGGGSTELIFLKDGVVGKLESFNNGTLRPVKENDAIMEKMRAYIQSSINKGEKINIVGTGGNLRRLGKMRKKVFATGNGTSIKKEEVNWFYNEIKGLTPAEITKRFELKSDRADVIGAALRIFSTIVNEVNSEAIYLSKLGLSDSILNKLSE